MLTATLTSCAQPSPRELAVESARTSWLSALETLNALPPDLPSGGFHEYFTELVGGSVNTYLLDADEAAVRAAGYELQAQSAFILEASESDSGGAVLMYISGVSETGGGGTYKKEIVFTCASVDIDLTQQRVVAYEAADCTDSIYAVLGHTGEIDFGDIARATDLE